MRARVSFNFAGIDLDIKHLHRIGADFIDARNIIAPKFEIASGI